MRPIVIQGAMDVETDHLVSKLDGASEIQIGAYRFWQGAYRGVEVVVSRTGVGTIAAAGATALGIRTFDPAVVINQGLAGAHREELRRGDIVIGVSCIAIHELCMGTRGKGEGIRPEEWTLYDDAGNIEAQALPADAGWTARFKATPYREGRKLVGRLGSGDLFSREYDRILWLRERAGEFCEDMESIAAFRICHAMGVPCAGLRIISNNELTGEPYRRELGVWLQKFILGTLIKMR